MQVYIERYTETKEIVAIFTVSQIEMVIQGSIFKLIEEYNKNTQDKTYECLIIEINCTKEQILAYQLLKHL
jgi:hypothetical protein